MIAFDTHFTVTSFVSASCRSGAIAAIRTIFVLYCVTGAVPEKNGQHYDEIYKLM